MIGCDFVELCRSPSASFLANCCSSTSLTFDQNLHSEGIRHAETIPIVTSWMLP